MTCPLRAWSSFGYGTPVAPVRALLETQLVATVQAGYTVRKVSGPRSSVQVPDPLIVYQVPAQNRRLHGWLRAMGPSWCHA